tara:strand:+ start:1037 stop:1300 length:264 start_codon:yes stop_codon:yes gene_type:complete
MNPLISRIWDLWTNSPQDELFAILSEFREDYSSDDTWLHAIDIIEEAILKEDYDRAEIIFEEMRPDYLTFVDYEVFTETIDAARWGY